MMKLGAFVAVGLMTMTGCLAHPSPGGQAASNDGTTMSTGQFAVDTASQLPDCDETTEAYVAYVKDESSALKCTSGRWATTGAAVN